MVKLRTFNKIGILFLLILLFIFACDGFNGFGGYPGFLSLTTDFVDLSSSFNENARPNSYTFGTYTDPIDGTNYLGLIVNYDLSGKQLILLDEELTVLQTVQGDIAVPERWSFNFYSNKILVGKNTGITKDSWNVGNATENNIELSESLLYAITETDETFGFQFTQDTGAPFDLLYGVPDYIDLNGEHLPSGATGTISSTFSTDLTSYLLRNEITGVTQPIPFRSSLHFRNFPNNNYFLINVDAEDFREFYFLIQLDSSTLSSPPVNSPFYIFVDNSYEGRDENSPISIIGDQVVIRANWEDYAQLYSFNPSINELAFEKQIDLRPIIGEVQEANREERRLTTYASDGSAWFVFDPLSKSVYKLAPWW
jgi:hypothetical protein